MFKPVDADMDFVEMEKKWLKHWDEKGINKKYREKNSKSNKYFSFLDGPITANNPMGIHHAWGRTYKDLWPKFFNLLGYKQRFQNGFDCQGLWVEVEVEKELGLRSKKDIENLVPGNKNKSIAKFVQLCKDRVKKFAGIQTEQSKRLGYFADWDHSYFTMSDENNYMIWHFLKTCFDNGWIYKGHESVPWCPRCETAISQHEMLTEDYKELIHDSVYFKFPIVGRKDENLLVWTTTPWTIPANVAVAVDKTFNYALVETEEERLWLANDRIKEVLNVGVGHDRPVPKVIKIVKGEELVGLKYKGSFDDLPAVAKVAEKNPDNFHTVFATDQMILPVTTIEGTGMVHTAVSAGVEDFKMGKKLGLPMIPVIEDDASYLPNLGFLSGKNAKKHPEIILDYLKEKDAVFKILKYKHRYPACWRCKTELVWKVEDEWYVAMDRSPLQSQKSKVKSQKLTLRERMIEVAKSIRWMPEFGLERELDWLKNMHDWLISKKNRYWGLALPIYECKKCKHFEVIGSKEELKKRAISGFDKFEGKSPHKPFIDEVKIKCYICNAAVDRINDVGNPWLDAGIVAYSTISENNKGIPLYKKDKKEWRKWFPADFITESFPGQFKNWFYALIAESTVLKNEPPFKRVLGYGTLLGEDGRAMHKSWGNSIEFNEGADKIGVDITRWMFSRQNPADNMLFGYKKASEVRRQFYLILWNVYKFFVEYANLDKWSGGGHPEGVLDKWILSRFTSLVLLVEKNLKEFNAKDASIEIEKFVSDLSTWYIRRSRDRVWINSEDNDDKNNFYSNLNYILVNLSIILSPFLPFLTEEMYVNLTGEQSVHLENWPSFAEASEGKPIIDEKLEKDMTIARQICEAGHAKRKLDGVKLRVPLLSLDINVPGTVVDFPGDIFDVILKELNVKNIVVNKKVRYPAKPVVVSQESLKKEGEIRGLVRQIQANRKELGLKPEELINLTIPEDFKEETEIIKKKVLAKEIKFGPKIIVSK